MLKLVGLRIRRRHCQLQPQFLAHLPHGRRGGLFPRLNLPAGRQPEHKLPVRPHHRAPDQQHPPRRIEQHHPRRSPYPQLTPSRFVRSAGAFLLSRDQCNRHSNQEKQPASNCSEHIPHRGRQTALPIARYTPNTAVMSHTPPIAGSHDPHRDRRKNQKGDPKRQSPPPFQQTLLRLIRRLGHVHVPFLRQLRTTANFTAVLL